VAFRASSASSDGAGSAASLAVTIDADAVAGDIGLIVLYKFNDNAVTPPTDWVLKADGATDDPPHIYLYWKQIAAGEPGTDVTFSWTGSTYRDAVFVALSGRLQGSDPFDGVVCDVPLGDATSIVLTSITPATALCDLIGVGAASDLAGGGSISSSAFTAEAIEFDDAIAVYYTEAIAAGATGTKTITYDASTGGRGGFLCALKPAAGGDPELLLIEGGKLLHGGMLLRGGLVRK
jgi:hypothetical protein